MQQTLEFLRRLYGDLDVIDGTFVISHIHKASKGIDTFKYPFNKLEELDWSPHLEANQNGWDIYFGSAVRSNEFLARRGKSRGATKDCVLSTHLSIDIDFLTPGAHMAENLPAGFEDIAPIIDKIGKEPSIVVHSGYGAHLHFVYNRSEELDSGQSRASYNRMRKQAHKPYHEAFKEKGWNLDATHNLDRIWRLPGFLNWKIPEDPKMVEVIYGIEEALQQYDIVELLPVKTRNTAPPAVSIPALSSGPIKTASAVGDLRPALKAYADKYHDDALECANSGYEEQAEEYARKSVYVKRLLAGESIEDKGKRDEALTVVCGIISYLCNDVDEFTEDDLEYIVEGLFRESLTQWVEDSPDDTDLEREMGKVIDKLQRIKAKDVENRIAGLSGLRKALKSRNQDFLAAQSTDPLSEGSVEEEEMSDSDLLKQGLILYQNSVYCWDWKNERYAKRAASAERDIRQMIRSCWPEDDGSCPFDHSFVNDEGKAVSLPFDHLQKNYGSWAEDSYYSFLNPQTCFDPKNSAFIINPSPWRYTEPRFDSEIDHWLKLLGGEQDYDTLCDWLAGTIHLDRACAAIYLKGPPGCGKTLFGHGAAQLWSNHASLYEEAASSYNGALIQSPILLIDETFSVQGQKNPTGILRRLIAQDTHAVNQKYQAKLQLRNHVRVVIAANNDSVLSSGREERLSLEDSQAIAERIIYIEVPKGAKEFFEKDNRDNRITKKWMDPDLGYFAKHVLWLAQTRDLSDRGRFLVTGRRTKMHESLLFQGNERSLVLEWLVRFSEAPAKVQAKVAKELRPAEIGNGIVAVNTKLVKDKWDVFGNGKSDASIEHSHLLRHFKALSNNTKSVQIRIGKGKPRYWPIPIERILSFADSYDIGDIEKIKELAALDQEITRKVLESKSKD